MKDLFAITGIALLSYSGWLVYPPLMFATAGAACLAVGLGIAKRNRK